MSIMSIGSAGAVGPYSGPSAISGAGASAAADPTSPREAFEKYQAMTPAQKMRAMMLARLGLTEEQVKALPDDKRKAVEDKIKDMIKQQVQNDPALKRKTGILADVMA
ncbi:MULTISPECIES: hypothetical protein [Caulobacter]|jgi:hypothetical protein|uniref:Uncharacterized protein n=1 Tax=Caulobacter vibrioides OR37 TaxID=1292034 RepID=R0EEN5_CAUVI|nr:MULTISPECIES: hypothetical protein [Caulobacter]ENZ80524.1 hypothetical protein OR37_03550 [Caulobacter vibrioides OR37]